MTDDPSRPPEEPETTPEPMVNDQGSAPEPEAELSPFTRAETEELLGGEGFPMRVSPSYPQKER